MYANLDIKNFYAFMIQNNSQSKKFKLRLNNFCNIFSVLIHRVSLVAYLYRFCFGSWFSQSERWVQGMNWENQRPKKNQIERYNIEDCDP